MSTSPASKIALTKPALAKPAVAKPAPSKAAAAKPASALIKATVKLPVKAPLTSKPVVANKPVVSNKPAVSSKPTTSSAAKPASNATLKGAVQLKPKLNNGKKVMSKKDNNEHKKDDKKDNKTKPEKVKMERDSFTMPKDEYAQLALLKGRLTAMGQPAKKSELLRAGVKLLAAMSDNTLKTTLAKVPVIKTGRPNK